MSTKKFYLITPEKKFDADSELVKNLQRVLSAAGDYDLVAEPSNPVTLLHVAIGLLSGNEVDLPDSTVVVDDEAEGDKGTKEEPKDEPKEPKEEPAPAEEPPKEEVTSAGDFSFESLGKVSLDGELIEAFFDPDAKDSILEIESVNVQGNRLDYRINESKFATYVPVSDGMATQIVEHRITVNNQSALATFQIRGASSPRLVIGSDYKRLFA